MTRPPPGGPPVELGGVEIYCDDDLFVKQMVLAKVGHFVEQHVHAHDHVTMVAVGAVDVWLDGEHLGLREAPTAITVPAMTEHVFQAAVDGVVLYCIHNLHGQGYPAVRARA